MQQRFNGWGGPRPAKRVQPKIQSQRDATVRERAVRFKAAVGSVYRVLLMLQRLLRSAGGADFGASSPQRLKSDQL